MDEQKTLFKNRTMLGVLIMRVQVPFLTKSHLAMIQTIQQRYPRMVILLGVAKKISFDNPYSFDFRRQMLLSELELRPHDVILPLLDNLGDNPAWVASVDQSIDSLLSPAEEAILYGGRDSFIPYYTKDGGRYPTQELLPQDNNSGTELRNIGATEPPIYSPEAAKAMLWFYSQLEAQGAITS